LPKYTEIPAIEKKLCDAEIFLAQKGIFLEKIKDIPYGVRIVAKGPTDEGNFSVYYSDKKGFSIVEDNDSELTKEATAIIKEGRELIVKEKKSQSFTPHFGSDEAGKGDFFGPLVAAGFCLETAEIRDDLIAMGVCDSKKLNDIKISELARKLYAKYGNHIVVISPSVEKYNELYASFNNLNFLLGWMHARVMEDLKERFMSVNLGNFDKFAEKDLVIRFLKKHKELKIDALVHGEDKDIAIAAASVIARDCFVRKINELSKSYEIKIPLGAGNYVIKTGKEFVAKHGRGKLINVCKTHFKTVRELE